MTLSEAAERIRKEIHKREVQALYRVANELKAGNVDEALKIARETFQPPCPDGAKAVCDAYRAVKYFTEAFQKGEG